VAYVQGRGENKRGWEGEKKCCVCKDDRGEKSHRGFGGQKVGGEAYIFQIREEALYLKKRVEVGGTQVTRGHFRQFYSCGGGGGKTGILRGIGKEPNGGELEQKILFSLIRIHSGERVLKFFHFF